MAEFGAVSQRQARFLLALESERSITAAARLAKVAPRTATRWLASGPVAAALQTQTTALLASGAAALVADVGQARAALVAVLDDPKARPGDRIRAASAILGAALQYAELASLAARLDSIERRLNGQGDTEQS